MHNSVIFPIKNIRKKLVACSKERQKVRRDQMGCRINHQITLPDLLYHYSSTNLGFLVLKVMSMLKYFVKLNWGLGNPTITYCLIPERFLLTCIAESCVFEANSLGCLFPLISMMICSLLYVHGSASSRVGRSLHSTQSPSDVSTSSLLAPKQ